jgi:hypothetical protein
VALIGDEPSTSLFRLSTQALNRKPILPRVVWDCQVNGFMDNEITQYEIRGHDEPPVEREIAERRAIPPFCTLAHYINPVRLPLEPLRDGFKEPRDLLPSLLA